MAGEPARRRETRRATGAAAGVSSSAIARCPHRHDATGRSGATAFGWAHTGGAEPLPSRGGSSVLIACGADCGPDGPLDPFAGPLRRRAHVAAPPDIGACRWEAGPHRQGAAFWNLRLEMRISFEEVPCVRGDVRSKSVGDCGPASDIGYITSPGSACRCSEGAGRRHICFLKVQNRFFKRCVGNMNPGFPLARGPGGWQYISLPRGPVPPAGTLRTGYRGRLREASETEKFR